MLNWCLKQTKDFIFKFSTSGSFFSEKEFLNLYTMILVSFPSGGCVDEAVNINKLSRIQVCLSPLLSYIDSDQFHEWSRSLLDYKKNNI